MFVYVLGWGGAVLTGAVWSLGQISTPLTGFAPHACRVLFVRLSEQRSPHSLSDAANANANSAAAATSRLPSHMLTAEEGWERPRLNRADLNISMAHTPR